MKSELLNFVSVLPYRFIVHSQEYVAPTLYRVNEQLLVLLIREGLQQVSHAASLELEPLYFTLRLVEVPCEIIGQSLFPSRKRIALVWVLNGSEFSLSSR